MFTFVSSGGVSLRTRFAQRAFYSLASPGRAMDAERIPPSSRRVAAGDKTPTKPALLITVSVTGLIRAASRISGRRKKPRRRGSSNGHRDRLSLRREDRLRWTAKECSLCCYERSRLATRAGWVLVRSWSKFFMCQMFREFRSRCKKVFTPVSGWKDDIFGQTHSIK